MKKKSLILLLIILNVEATNYNSLLFNGNCVACHFEKKSLVLAVLLPLLHLGTHHNNMKITTK